MGVTWADSINATAAVASAAAAGAALFAARRANATANTVASIERDRWHAELMPKFGIGIERGQGERATLDVQLTGPIPLCHLDEIRMRIISSDDAERVSRLPGRPPTQEDIDAQVWGPYRFTHGADGADLNGHTVRPFSLEVGRGRPFSIEPTRPPAWQEGNDVNEGWREQWRGAPLRLVLECSRDGFKRWVIPYDIEINSARVRFL